MNDRAPRLAVIVSHPIQYFVPLYRRLAASEDVDLRVFFTWHSGQAPVRDPGFARDVRWDIPLTAGYAFEPVPNTSHDPGTHHFWGLQNPSLVERVVAWRPDAAVVHGWASLSHLQALRSLPRRGIPTLLRGDSHLLDAVRSGLGWRGKKALLSRIFSWPTGFLVVGQANRAYYQAFGVAEDRLFACPHSIDVGRFAEPSAWLEAEAARWRQGLGIAPDRPVVLYAGKFERRKRVTELLRAALANEQSNAIVVLVGSGETQREIDAIASAHPQRIRVLPFQNQSRMPVVYRLGDLFVLPSSHGESWGLAVNEALASGRPVLVSDRVGCAVDVVDETCGRIFAYDEPTSLMRALCEMTRDAVQLNDMRNSAKKRAEFFDISVTERALLDAVTAVCR